MQISRREIAGALLGSAALAQAPAPQPPATPDRELEAAREQFRRAAQALSRYDLPMAVEPACIFTP